MNQPFSEPANVLHCIPIALEGLGVELFLGYDSFIDDRLL